MTLIAIVIIEKRLLIITLRTLLEFKINICKHLLYIFKVNTNIGKEIVVNGIKHIVNFLIRKFYAESLEETNNLEKN